MKTPRIGFGWAGWLALLLAAGLTGGGCEGPKALAGAGILRDSPMTKERALTEELRAGNARFVGGHPLKRDWRGDVKATAPGQYPKAVVLSCLDSRQPIETVLDQGIGDIFSARVAGNVLNADILGSMEFACKVSGAKLIVVIGHSNCGAVKGAVDGVDLGNLTGLLAQIKPAIEKVRLVMREIRERSAILREMLDKGQIGLAGGMYDLETGEVRFY